MIATYVKDVNPTHRGNQKLYKLVPPMTYSDGWPETQHTTEYVIVSAADVPYSGPETYIFPSDSDGNVVGWGELDGSYRGGLSHDEALRNAGYSVVDD